MKRRSSLPPDVPCDKHTLRKRYGQNVVRVLRSRVLSYFRHRKEKKRRNESMRLSATRVITTTNSRTWPVIIHVTNNQHSVHILSLRRARDQKNLIVANRGMYCLIRSRVGTCKTLVASWPFCTVHNHLELLM